MNGFCAFSFIGFPDKSRRSGSHLTDHFSDFLFGNTISPVGCLTCWESCHLALTVARPKSPIFTVKLSSWRNILLLFKSRWIMFLWCRYLRWTETISVTLFLYQAYRPIHKHLLHSLGCLTRYLDCIKQLESSIIYVDMPIKRWTLAPLGYDGQHFLIWNAAHEEENIHMSSEKMRISTFFKLALK